MVEIKGTAFAKLERLRRKARSALLRNAIDLADLGAPTPTIGTSATITNRQRLVSANPELFRAIGGVPNYSSGRIPANTVISGGTDGATKAPTSTAWEFMFDGQVFELYTFGSTIKFRVLVNDQYISKAGHSFGTTSNTTACYAAFDLGSRAVRKITVESEQNWVFKGVNLPDFTADVWAPTADDTIRAAVVGDSYTLGSQATLRPDNWANRLGKLIGIDDIWNMGLSGTGYIAATASASKFLDRLPDLVACAPDVVIVHGGYNDASQTPSAVQVAVTAYLQAVRAALPEALIFVLGCNAGCTGPSTAHVATEVAIAAAVTAINDPYTFFVPVSPTANSAASWLYGTGKVGATASNGNADLYVGPDGVHPSDAGYAYYGARAAQGLRKALQLA